MPEMIAFQGKERRINIPEEIGQQWLVVGTILLDDKSGSIISAIARHHGKDIEGISCEILEHWLKGRDCTWRELLSVLRKARCTTLAGTIEEALTAEEAEQGKFYPLYAYPNLYISSDRLQYKGDQESFMYILCAKGTYGTSHATYNSA